MHRNLVNFHPNSLQSFVTVGRFATSLLEAGATSNAVTGDDGLAALHVAAGQAYREVCAVLLAAGAAVNALTSRGVTPLHMAAKHGNRDVCDIDGMLLSAAADVATLTPNGFSSLHLAAERGHSDVRTALLAAGDGVDPLTVGGNIPLFMATLEGHFEVCKALLAAGANVSALTQRKAEAVTSLQIAADRGYHRVCMALLAAGAHTDVINAHGDPALCCAMTTAMFVIPSWQLEPVSTQSLQVAARLSCWQQFEAISRYAWPCWRQVQR